MASRLSTLTVVSMIAAVMVLSLFAGVTTSGLSTPHVANAVVDRSTAIPTDLVLPGGSGIAGTVSTVSASHVHPDISSYVIILPNGTVTGAASPALSQSGYTYTMTGSAVGAIVDERSGSILQGGDFTLTTSPSLGWGIQINSTSNVSVEGFNIADESKAIEVLNSTGVSVEYSTATPTSSTAFLALHSSGVEFTYDVANGSNIGFGANASSDITFSDDVADADAYGYEVDQVNDASLYSDSGISDHYGVVLEFSQYPSVEYGNYSLASVDGIGLEEVEAPYVTGVVAQGCSAGLWIFSSDDAYVSYSNFTKATGEGGDIILTDFSVIQDSSFGQSAGDGLVLNHGLEDNVSYDSSNGSAISGIVLGNMTYTDAFANYAVGNGYNGLAITGGSDINSIGNAFDSSTNPVGNGTSLRATSDVEILGGTDEDEDVGVYDVGSTGLDVLEVNASYDVVGLLFAQDQTPYADGNVAEHNTDEGIVFELSSDFSAESNNVSYNDIGFLGAETLDGDVYDNTAFDCTDAGFFFEIDLDSYVQGDYARNTPVGFIAAGSTDTDLDEVFVTNASNIGVIFTGTSDDALVNSNISSSHIGFSLMEADYSNISGNTFYKNTFDFEIVAAGMLGAVVYWNNFLFGGGWEFDATGGTPLAVVFDAGYPGGGNHWSNLTGPDVEHGPGQNLSGADGIVDVPLPISGTYVDHYPLTRTIDVENLTVEFHETGLPSDTVWGIHFGSEIHINTTYASIYADTGAAAWASYPYFVYAPAGWTPATRAGTVNLTGSAVVITIAFTAVTYATTFQETGLPAGATWSVNVSGVTYSGVGSTIVVPLANGTHSYTVGAVGGFVVAPRSGWVNITANQPTVTIAYTAVLYAVTFTESGLPSGTSWGVTLGGSTQTSVGTTISIDVANGSYPYRVANVSGYSLAGASGTQLVSGPGASVTVAYTANSSSAPGGVLLFWVLLAAVIVLAVLVVLLLMWGRKKPGSAPAVAGWTPPTSVPPPPTGATGAPPPGAVAPPPPNWKES
jgi:parallel beta-helix repeat protein